MKPAKRFDVVAARLRHSEAQSRPHSVERIRRFEACGRPISIFVFPLDELKPRDRVRKEKAWQAKSDREKVLRRMRLQFVRSESMVLPLPGRPIVRCIRYSSVEPDSTAGWGKVAVDCLQPSGVRTVTKTVKHPHGHDVKLSRKVPYEGLGIIRNDRPAECEVVEWWEPAKRGDGFCVVEVWTD